MSSLAGFILRSNWAAVYRANMPLSIFQGSFANHLGVDHGRRYSWASAFVLDLEWLAYWAFLIYLGLVDSIAIVYVAHKALSVWVDERA